MSAEIGCGDMTMSEQLSRARMYTLTLPVAAMAELAELLENSNEAHIGFTALRDLRMCVNEQIACHEHSEQYAHVCRLVWNTACDNCGLESEYWDALPVCPNHRGAVS